MEKFVKDKLKVARPHRQPAPYAVQQREGRISLSKMPLVPVTVVSSGSRDRLSKKKDASLRTVKIGGTGERIEVRTTTVDSENRRRDQVRVERELGLPEFGPSAALLRGPDSKSAARERRANRSSYVLLFLTRGEWGQSSGGEEIPLTLAAQGYTRIVYGDHGPYIELASHQINWASFPYVNPKPDYSFYDEAFSECGTMVYLQKKYVSGKPSPPGGKWSVDNQREEGYANYVPGMHYVEASCDRFVAIDARTGRPFSLAGFGGLSFGANQAKVLGDDGELYPKDRFRRNPFALSEDTMWEIQGQWAGFSLTESLGGALGSLGSPFGAEDGLLAVDGERPDFVAAWAGQEAPAPSSVSSSGAVAQPGSGEIPTGQSAASGVVLPISRAGQEERGLLRETDSPGARVDVDSVHAVEHAGGFGKLSEGEASPTTTIPETPVSGVPATASPESPVLSSGWAPEHPATASSATAAEEPGAGPRGDKELLRPQPAGGAWTIRNPNTGKPLHTQSPAGSDTEALPGKQPLREIPVIAVGTHLDHVVFGDGHAQASLYGPEQSTAAMGPNYEAWAAEHHGGGDM